MEKVIQFLKENMVCTMATCSNNNPRASVMEYMVVNDHIMLGTDGESIKAQNLRANNKISVSVCNMPKFVVVEGTTATCTQDEIDTYNGILFERHPEFKTYLEQGMMRPMTHFKVVPTEVYYSDYSQGMVPPEIIKP